MSAQIPSTMLLSDLLKSTGYDCPEELQGRTFEEATAGGDVQTNKEATIDVSAYTEPVVITPDTDYESMKKNTVTLNNIPAVKTEEDLSVTENGEYTPDEGKTFGKVTVAVPQGTLFCWKTSDGNFTYTDTEHPKVGGYTFRGKSNTTTGEIVIRNNAISSVAADFSSLELSGTGASWNRYATGDITIAGA